MSKWKLLGVALLLAAPSFAQKPSKSVVKASEIITAEGLKDYLTFIASDALQGRDTPSPGLDAAAEFLRFFLKRWGFVPGGDNGTFFQNIPLTRLALDLSKSSLKIGDKTYEIAEDALFGVGAAPGTVRGEGMFLRISTALPADVDLTGKILIVYGQRREFDAVAYAKKNGAIGLVRLTQGEQEEWLRFAGFRRNNANRGFAIGERPSGLPSMDLSPNAAKSVLEGAPTAEDVPTALGKTVELTVSGQLETKNTQNVVAIWPGTDATLKSEYVALGAHYDHVGVGRPNATGDGIFNGADDDGSGTVSLLAICEALVKGKVSSKRSLLFVWHCGEEKGLWGSEYFTSHPTVPIDKITAQLNIDMIGRSKPVGDENPRNANLSGPSGIYVIGSRMLSTQLGNIVDGVNGNYLKLQYDYRYDDPKDPNRFYYRSDHFNYAKHNIPIAFWFDGVHEDYHQVGDEVSKIDFKKMQSIVRTVFLTAGALSDLPVRPQLDPKPK